MLIAPNDDFTRHAVGVFPPTAENPGGYHRLIGGSVELGESHCDTIVREVAEELGATIQNLTFLTTVENIFRIDGALGHEIVFLYTGRLDPMPPARNALLTETDGGAQPFAWRRVRDERESLPLYPAASVDWVRTVADRHRDLQASATAGTPAR